MTALNFPNVTPAANVDTAIPEVWAKRVLADALYKGFFGGMTGAEFSGLPVIQVSELRNGGDLIHIQVTGPLSGAGVEGDTTTLQGAEDTLTATEMKTSPIYYRNAVSVFRRTNKKTIYDLRSEAKSRLAEWAMQKMDAMRFANYVSNAPVPGTGETQGAATTPNVLKVGGGGAVPTTLWVAADFNDVGAADTLDVVSLQKARLALYNARALPISAAGKPFYVAVVHPNCLYGLKREPEWKSVV